MLIKKPITQVIKELDLPENSKFMGYVVRNPEKDEFLVKYKASNDSIGALWAKNPGIAKVFSQREKAKKAIKILENKELILGWLFDAHSGEHEHRF